MLNHLFYDNIHEMDWYIKTWITNMNTKSRKSFTKWKELEPQWYKIVKYCIPLYFGGEISWILHFSVLLQNYFRKSVAMPQLPLVHVDYLWKYFYAERILEHFCENISPLSVLSYLQRSTMTIMAGKYLYNTIAQEQKRIKKIPKFFLTWFTLSFDAFK